MGGWLEEIDFNCMKDKVTDPQREQRIVFQLHLKTKRVFHTQVLVWPSLRAQEQNDNTEPLGPCDRHPKYSAAWNTSPG
ncbi:hypothetical protein KOW79_013975 [Hemibagrus wyckioides]|uniref:Uncharacterized protein n=1 Tax=Hemibagrus wyckioides TaxID=337641 RepID=A0A9D3NHS2_9TELE|nr:hypothetical protein KOW79_013975 [Hemibagrus wyckioides]